jgi:predicted O-methyltransferase YrrM
VDLLKAISHIEGWLLDQEALLLYNLAQQCPSNTVIVEIGSWKGRSTVCLALGSQAGNQVKVFAIDPHTGNTEHRRRYGQVWTYDEFMANIKQMKVDNLVVPVLKTSAAAASNFNEPIGLIFIDGAHEYEAVKQDFELWYPKVIQGGVIALHDFCYYPGPKAVAEEYICNSANFSNVTLVDSIVYGIKIK